MYNNYYLKVIPTHIFDQNSISFNYIWMGLSISLFYYTQNLTDNKF